MDRIVPKADAAALAYLLNLSSCLTARWPAYGVGPADAEHLARVVGDFREALTRSNTRSTRTTAAVLLKDQHKAVATDLGRAVVRLIKANMGVSDAAKLDAGVPLPRVGAGAAIGPPTTRPVLSIVGSVKGSMTVAFRDAAEPDRRSRPWGVKGLNLYRVIGPAAAVDYREAAQVGGYTRGPVGVGFDAADDGRKATFFACWISPTLAAGPMSAGVSMTIAA